MTKQKTVADRIRHLEPCCDALVWAKKYHSPTAAWKACKRGDWMIWILGRQIDCEPWTDGRKPLLACCLDCAETVKHLWPKIQAKGIGDAVAVLRQWIAGEASVEQAKEARKKLYVGGADAAYAAAADAAYAAAYAADADAADADDAAYAAADAADAAYAAAYADAASTKVLAECAAIVRMHYPKPPRIKETP